MDIYFFYITRLFSLSFRIGFREVIMLIKVPCKMGAIGGGNIGTGEEVLFFITTAQLQTYL